MEKTLTILKPDTVKRGNSGAVISMIEAAGFRIRAAKMLHLAPEQAEKFYAVHRDRPFFQDLVSFMSEGAVLVMVLEADNAIERLRKLMGATDPSAAEAGTIRQRFGTNVERNAIHGSDASETSAFEIAYFFSQLEIV